MLKKSILFVVSAALLCGCASNHNSNYEAVKLDFLPKPPAEGSVNFENDKAVYKSTRALKGTPRWELAQKDTEENIDNILKTFFAESFMPITKEKTPHLYNLGVVALKTSSAACRAPKKKYQRTRPFVYFKAEGQTCMPSAEPKLINNGSYPSGHTARAWGLAVALAEAAPEYANAILSRGYEAGQSRVICGAHWQSDVDAARLLASAAINDLHNDAEFIKLMQKAKDEVRALSAKK